MTHSELIDSLERSPVIASFHEREFEQVLSAPPELLFDLKASLTTVKKRIDSAHKAGKHIFTHIQWDMTGYYLEIAKKVPNFHWITAEEVEREAALPTAYRQFWEDRV